MAHIFFFKCLPWILINMIKYLWINMSRGLPGYGRLKKGLSSGLRSCWGEEQLLGRCMSTDGEAVSLPLWSWVKEEFHRHGIATISAGSDGCL